MIKLLFFLVIHFDKELFYNKMPDKCKYNLITKVFIKDIKEFKGGNWNCMDTYLEWI